MADDLNRQEEGGQRRDGAGEMLKDTRGPWALTAGGEEDDEAQPTGL